MTNTTDVMEQMDALIEQWQAAGDDKELLGLCFSHGKPVDKCNPSAQTKYVHTDLGSQRNI